MTFKSFTFPFTFFTQPIDSLKIENTVDNRLKNPNHQALAVTQALFAIRLVLRR